MISYYPVAIYSRAAVDSATLLFTTKMGELSENRIAIGLWDSGAPCVPWRPVAAMATSNICKTCNQQRIDNCYVSNLHGGWHSSATSELLCYATLINTKGNCDNRDQIFIIDATIFNQLSQFCLSVCLAVCPSVRLSVCLPVCLFVCLSVCLSVVNKYFPVRSERNKSYDCISAYLEPIRSPFSWVSLVVFFFYFVMHTYTSHIDPTIHITHRPTHTCNT